MHHIHTYKEHRQSLDAICFTSNLDHDSAAGPGYVLAFKNNRTFIAPLEAFTWKTSLLQRQPKMLNNKEIKYFQFHSQRFV